MDASFLKAIGSIQVVFAEVMVEARVHHILNERLIGLEEKVVGIKHWLVGSAICSGIGVDECHSKGIELGAAGRGCS